MTKSQTVDMSEPLAEAIRVQQIGTMLRRAPAFSAATAVNSAVTVAIAAVAIVYLLSLLVVVRAGHTSFVGIVHIGLRNSVLVEELEAGRTTLLGAIENLLEGFALWDAEDRLAVCNERHRALEPAGGDYGEVGTAFAAAVRAAAPRVLAGPGGAEAWIADRLARLALRAMRSICRYVTTAGC